MSIFIIKIIACITMIFDHVKYVVPEMTNFVTIYMGRMSFPLFAFIITEGFVHTKNLKAYFKRLLLFAIISQIPFMLFRSLVGRGEYKILNILFTFLLGLIAITIYEKIDRKYISIPLVGLIVFLGKILVVDYGWYGVSLVFLLYIFKNEKTLLVSSFILLHLIFYYERLFKFFEVGYLISFGFTISTIIVILLYNGKLGKKCKYFFYWFYPIHMTLLYAINLFVYKP